MRALSDAEAARGSAPVRAVVIGGALAGVELAAALCSRLVRSCPLLLLTSLI